MVTARTAPRKPSFGDEGSGMCGGSRVEVTWRGPCFFFVFLGYPAERRREDVQIGETRRRAPPTFISTASQARRGHVHQGHDKPSKRLGPRGQRGKAGCRATRIGRGQRTSI